jgi:hypothetical protein
MAKKQKRFAHLYDLTKAEAQEYARDMAMEATLLVKLFPHLTDSFDRDELPISFLLKQGARRAAKAGAKAKPAPKSVPKRK